WRARRAGYGQQVEAVIRVGGRRYGPGLENGERRDHGDDLRHTSSLVVRQPDTRCAYGPRVVVLLHADDDQPAGSGGPRGYVTSERTLLRITVAVELLLGVEVEVLVGTGRDQACHVGLVRGDDS